MVSADISSDRLIDGFIDSIWLERGLSQNTLSAYRQDLSNFSNWLNPVNLENADKVDVYINSFLSLYLVWNQGIGFGLFSFDQSYIYNGITLFILLINLVIVYLIYKEKAPKTYFLAIILGGSSGNLFDRYYYNSVPDFIDLSYKGYHWFIFNVADIFITLGIICLILAEFLNYKKTK